MKLKIKRRKKPKPKVRKRLEIKRRASFICEPSIPEEVYLEGRRATLGSCCCSEPLCNQAVYEAREKYCYFHRKLREGLLDVKNVY